MLEPRLDKPQIAATDRSRHVDLADTCASSTPFFDKRGAAPSSMTRITWGYPVNERHRLLYDKALIVSIHSWRSHEPLLRSECIQQSYTLGPAIQFGATQIVATLAVRTSLVFNNMLFQGPSSTWQDCRYELLPYLHIPRRCAGPCGPRRRGDLPGLPVTVCHGRYTSDGHASQ